VHGVRSASHGRSATFAAAISTLVLSPALVAAGHSAWLSPFGLIFLFPRTSRGLVLGDAAIAVAVFVVVLALLLRSRRATLQPGTVQASVR